jgi:hypothetical protein
MGWGKGKGKAVERALHQAERQEERAVTRALMHGDIAGALEHERNAEAIANAEARWKGKGRGQGKGYACPTEVVVVSPAPVAPVVAEAVPAPVTAVVVEAAMAPCHPKGLGKGTEHALHRAELHQEAIAGASLCHGDIIGAAMHAERASELKAAERAVHNDVVRAEARRAHHQEKRQEHMAARDLAHGNLLGALVHEVKASRAHHKEERLKAESHHHRGW